MVNFSGFARKMNHLSSFYAAKPRFYTTKLRLTIYDALASLAQKGNVVHFSASPKNEPHLLLSLRKQNSRR
ncbi:MAG: hypothetical protein U5L45_20245 [Saprospiraceae bacterium]|nr:hypothetical protein [Saprospiraceae bacterium]